MTWKQFIQHNIDKILLIALLHVIMAFLVTVMKDNPTLVDWLKGEASTVIGALIMLITGRHSVPDPTVTASTTITKTATIPDPKPADPAKE